MSNKIKATANFLKLTGSILTTEYKGEGRMPGEEKQLHIFQMLLQRKYVKFRFKYGSTSVTPPEPFHVLKWLTKTNPGTFEQWCTVHNYNTDSITEKRRWKERLREFKNLELLYDDAERQLLISITDAERDDAAMTKELEDFDLSLLDYSEKERYDEMMKDPQLTMDKALALSILIIQFEEAQYLTLCPALWNVANKYAEQK